MTTWKTLCAALALSGAALAQGEAPPLPELGGQADPRQEMLDLFKKVELRLREIDDLLYDASAGGSGVGDPEESGIGDLIRDSIDSSQQVLQDIDRIIEIAEQQSGTCSSTLSGSSDGQSESQSQKQQQGGQKESTPEAPQQGGDEPDEQPGDQPQPNDQPDGPPKSPEASPDQNPENRAGVDPPSDDTESVRYVDDVERWGHLPVHVQEVFRSEGGGDLPPQYRDWIEAYYKRLNRAP